jgi:hypothetical protein
MDHGLEMRAGVEGTSGGKVFDPGFKVVRKPDVPITT